MKKLVIIFILSISALSLGQSQDTIKWLLYNNKELGISFKYPSFVELKNHSAYLDSVSDACISLSFTYYPEYGNAAEMGGGDSTEILYLELEQSVDLVISKSKLSEVAPRYGYLLKDSLWYDLEMLENGWSDEPAAGYSFDDWNGYETYTPTSVYLKGGGCVTKAGDLRRLFLVKKFLNNIYIYAFAERFDFDDDDETLKEILESISLREGF